MRDSLSVQSPSTYICGLVIQYLSCSSCLQSGMALHQHPGFKASSYLSFFASFCCILYSGRKGGSTQLCWPIIPALFFAWFSSFLCPSSQDFFIIISRISPPGCWEDDEEVSHSQWEKEEEELARSTERGPPGIKKIFWNKNSYDTVQTMYEFVINGAFSGASVRHSIAFIRQQIAFGQDANIKEIIICAPVLGLKRDTLSKATNKSVRIQLPPLR